MATSSISSSFSFSPTLSTTPSESSSLSHSSTAPIPCSTYIPDSLSLASKSVQDLTNAASSSTSSSSSTPSQTTLNEEGLGYPDYMVPPNSPVNSQGSNSIFKKPDPRQKFTFKTPFSPPSSSSSTNGTSSLLGKRYDRGEPTVPIEQSTIINTIQSLNYNLQCQQKTYQKLQKKMVSTKIEIDDMQKLIKLYTSKLSNNK